MIQPLPPSPPGDPRVQWPVLNFSIDLLLGFAVLIAVSVVTALVWGVCFGSEQALQALPQGGTPAPGSGPHPIVPPGALAQMVLAVINTASPALLLYFWRRRASAAERQVSRAAIARRSTWGLVLAVALAVFGFSLAIGALAESLGVRPVPTNQALLKQALAQWPAFLVVFVVALAPAYEELLFRRVLFGRLLAAGRPWLGILLSSLAFALLHEVPGISGNGPWEMAHLWLVYSGMGAAFAWLYWRTGTLWAPIVAHGLNNAVVLIGLYWFDIS